MVNSDKEMEFNAHSQDSNHNITDDSSSDFLTGDEDFNSDNLQERTGPLFAPLSTPPSSEALAYSANLLYQNTTYRSLEQQVPFINNNTAALTNSQTNHQQTEPQGQQFFNDMTNDETNSTTFMNYDNLLQVPSPSLQSTISNASYYSTVMSLGDGQSMNYSLSPNGQSNSNLSSPYMYPLSASPCRPLVSLSPSSDTISASTNQELDQYNLINNDNNMNQENMDFDIHSLLEGANFLGAFDQFMNNSTHTYNQNNQNNMNGVNSSYFYNGSSNSVGFINNTNISYNNRASTSSLNACPTNSCSNFLVKENGRDNSLDENFASSSSSNKENATYKAKRKIKDVKANSKGTKGRCKIKQDKPKPKCPICSKEINRKQDVKRHMNVHEGSRPHECNLCHRHFARIDALYRHLKPLGNCQRKNNKDDKKKE